MSLALVIPRVEYESSYRNYISEIKANDDSMIPFVLNLPNDDFNSFLSEVHGYARGEGLAPEFVAHSTFWLIENSSEIVGIANIHHELTEKLKIEGGHIGYSIRPSRRGQGYGNAILNESLKEARKLGILKVLITCDKENVPSARVILRNGGTLESESYVEARQAVVQRYWINL